MPDPGEFDLVVAGGGLAGLTSGLFGARYGLSTLVLEAVAPGGHLMSIEKIEDYPGFPDGVAGYELGPNLQLQAANEGAEFRMAELRRLEPQDGAWTLATDEGSYRAKTVVIATGSKLKALGVPGEARLFGKGVSNCASCDGPFVRGKTVGVVGGGDSALQEALTLSQYASEVVVFHQGTELSAQHAFRRRVLQDPRITVRYRTVVAEILGEEAVTGVRIRDLATAGEARFEVAAVFIYVGLAPNTELLKDLLPLTDTGHVPTDIHMRTRIRGLFAAGDIREDSPAQAITSAADGAVAAIAAHRYLKEQFWPAPAVAVAGR